MKLFHATSEFAWEQIQKIGFIGVTEEILLPYIKDIFDILSVPEHKREKFYKRMSADLEENAPNGSVSFFPNYAKHMSWGRHLGKSLGEGFGHDLKCAVKYASRVTKTLSNENRLKIPLLVQTHVPVILKVDIPTSLIDNSEVIGTQQEHYTTGVVPLKYVIGMRYI